jgi:hypothetical protein
MAGFIARLFINIVNVAFMLFGIAVMIVGIITLANPDLIINGVNLIPGFTDLNYLINIQQLLVSSGIVLTVIGSVIFVMCFIGLVAGCTHGKVLVFLYISFVSLILAFELAVIIYNAVAYQNVQNRVQSLMLSALQQYFEPVQINNGELINGSTPGGQAWEQLQFEYGCCGAYGYQDFDTFNWRNDISYYNNSIVPPSCCIQVVQYRVATNIDNFANYENCSLSAPQFTNTRGCYYAIETAVASYANITVIIIASLIALEVIVLMLAMHLINLKREESRTGYA